MPRLNRFHYALLAVSFFVAASGLVLASDFYQRFVATMFLGLIGLAFGADILRRRRAVAFGGEAMRYLEGQERDTSQGRVGVEIEFLGVELDEAAQIVAETFDGTIEQKGRFERTVHTPLGEFVVERDSEPLKDADSTSTEDRGLGDELWLQVAEPFVPTEITTPPLQRSALRRLDELVASLRLAGATGTERRAVDALGVHFNPELPDPTAAKIVATLRAFFLLRSWLRDDVDPSRRLSPWVLPHSAEFVALVQSHNYAPDLDTLISDYIRLEPSRNRELDLLPLFAHLKPEIVEQVPKQKIKARPTYHYRLPDCRIGNADWSIAQEWQRWRAVERLAADPVRLSRWTALQERNEWAPRLRRTA